VTCFSNLGFKNRKFKGLARTLLAIAVLVLTLLIRIYLPTRAAQHFQDKGAQLLAEGLVQRAIPAYQEAAVLDPYSVQTHLALAKAEEKTNDYGKAIQDYKSTIVLYERQRPGVFDDSYFEAKINLARLLNLHDQDYTGVLLLLDPPDEVIPRFSDHNRKLYTYFWCTYLGWANLELKNYQEAAFYLGIALKYREGAAARYLLGRVFEDSKQEKEAAQQWTCFITIIQRDWKLPEKDREQEKEVQPDWISHAQDKQAGADRGTISAPPSCR
jgi:tetratricopeptide (TPR) repeat protein